MTAARWGHGWLVVLAAAACSAETDAPVADPGSESTPPHPGGQGGSDDEAPPTEVEPPIAAGDGVVDPPTRSLHGRRCGGTDWQLVTPWLLLPHAAPEVGPPEQMQRCVDRYAGWVTNEADAAGVSRASVYAALAASGQCTSGLDYDGALLPAELCTLVHPELAGEDCLAAMAATKSFGIGTVAAVIAATAEQHKRDVVPLAALLSNGAIRCGGDDRWKLQAPAGFVDRYVAAYNAYTARSHELVRCDKRIVVTVALYTGMDDPGDDGVVPGNGCWTYERVAKSKAEWKICNYGGTVYHADGVKWAYDDTNTNHAASLEKSRIKACKTGVAGRGYIYMTNRGSGWPKRVTSGVRAHFAQLYSGQYRVNDLQSLWVSSNQPGEPMVNFGEPTTGQGKIGDVTASLCKRVRDGGFFGVYIYPESLRANRMNAMVQALNACTGQAS